MGPYVGASANECRNLVNGKSLSPSRFEPSASRFKIYASLSEWKWIPEIPVSNKRLYGLLPYPVTFLLPFRPFSSFYFFFQSVSWFWRSILKKSSVWDLNFSHPDTPRMASGGIPVETNKWTKRGHWYLLPVSLHATGCVLRNYDSWPSTVCFVFTHLYKHQIWNSCNMTLSSKRAMDSYLKAERDNSKFLLSAFKVTMLHRQHLNPKFIRSRFLFSWQRKRPKRAL